MSDKKAIPPMDKIVGQYIKALTSNKSDKENIELEAKFATMGVRKLSYIDFNNVVKKLLSQGFRMTPKNEFLRIFNESELISGGIKNMRTEIGGMANISKYCKSNAIEENMNPVFDQKVPIIVDGEKISPVNNSDFNFRVSLNKERLFSSDSEEVKTLVDSWTNYKKTFRYISRTRLSHPDYPLNIDASIVKNSKTRGRKYVPEYNFIDSGILQSEENYEIEIEIDNEKIDSMVKIILEKKPKQTTATVVEYITKELIRIFKKTIKFVLSGIQETNYPIAYGEQDKIIQSYMSILWDKSYKENTRVYPKNFIGPSQLTLQMQNIIQTETNMDIPKITKDYTVTEKADGTRKLLFISEKGKIYFITTNMTVQFTGSQTPTKAIYNTIIDGEHILHNKKKEFINLYAAFDIYYMNKKDVRTLPFIKMEETPHSRLQLLSSVISLV